MGTSNLRPAIFNIHKWLGLHTSLFFIFIFTTGVILLVSDELEAVFHPQIWVGNSVNGEPVSFGTIYQSVTREFPQSQLFVIERQPQPWLGDRSYVTTGWGEKIVVWTHPSDGQILGVTKAANFRAFLHDLHDSLLVPRRIGFVLVASTSLILLTIITAGMITYRRFWRGLFRWPSKTNTARAHIGGLHRLIAVWSLVFLLITGISGAFFMLTGLGIDGSVPNPPAASPRNTVIPADFDGAFIDRAAIVAQGASGIHPTTLVLPGSKSANLLFSGSADGLGHLRGSTDVAVDPVNMRVLATIGPQDFRGNARLKPLMNALHFGQWGEPVSRLLWIVFGIFSIYLVVAGIRIASLTQKSSTDPDSNLDRSSIFRLLGIFKWAYAALILAVFAIGILRFGPPSIHWTTLQQTGPAEPTIKLQIFGNLRQGKAVKFRAIADGDQISSIQIFSEFVDGFQVVTSEHEGSANVFETMGEPGMNNLKIVVNRNSGEQFTALYDLGSAIW